ncbi:uncharacterized protein LOC134812613 [Bolinopsis microptera]|uniref:uncharacterized protein LOC134812613 n=1 Tax=Bolinopsis microptera TaxID=2820187 RepID=UPI00307AE03E
MSGRRYRRRSEESNSTYRRDSYDDSQAAYSRLKCWKCGKVGHAARFCNRITDKEELYEIDRIDPGIKFKLFKFSPVKVTTPGTLCGDCKAKSKESDDSETKEEEDPCKCTKRDPEHKPIDEFKDLNLDRKLLGNITDKSCCNFEVPTPIQRYALPIISEGHDVMGCAQTGTGKTAAYIIPMVKFIKDGGYKKKPVTRESPQKPEVLILAPTRELATQIEKTTRKLTNDIEPSCGVCVVHGGLGTNRKQQLDRVRNGCNILIGTTGRVRQLIEDFTISLENIKFFVLDEADKMLDMGFGPDIDLIIDSRKTDMPSTKLRQSLLFSATFRPDLQKVARKSLKTKYRLIEAGEIGSAQPNVTQNFELVDNYNQKLWRLKEILLDLLVTAEKSFLKHKCWEHEQGSNHPNIGDYILHMLGSCSDKKILVFVNTKKSAREIAYSVSEYIYDQCKGRFRKKFRDLYYVEDDADLIENFGAIYLSGELSQPERVQHLNAFKDGVYPIMVSTNVTARGIDIEGVTHVMNFDLPLSLYSNPKFHEHDATALREGRISKKPIRDQFEEYIHRIGRTGRAGNTGTAITFFQRDIDHHLAIPLVRMLSKAKQDVPEWLEEIAGKPSGGGGGGNKGGRGGGGGGTGQTPVIGVNDWNYTEGIGATELWGNET